MKAIKLSLLFLVLSGFLILALASCGEGPTPYVPSPSPESGKTAKPIPSDTITVLPTETFTPSPSPVPTATITPTLQPSETPLPTLTTLPTLSSQEAENKIRELYKTNGGCELPCWWGMTPGKTSSSEAQNMLSAISNQMLFSPTNYAKNYGYAWGYQAPGEKRMDWLLDVYVQNDKIFMLRPYVTEITNRRISSAGYFTPLKLLSRVGQPQEIYIKTFAETPNGSHPFVVRFFKPDQGFLISYSLHGIKVGDLIETCIQDNDSPTILLWKPGAFSKVTDINQFIGSLDEPPLFQPLESATHTSVSLFYKSFQTTHTFPCIQTPIDLWK